MCIRDRPRTKLEKRVTGLSYEGNAVYFYYDTDGTPTAMSSDDTMYYYIKNLQGDIVKIVNQDGNMTGTFIK